MNKCEYGRYLCKQDDSSDGDSAPENLSLPKNRTSDPPPSMCHAQYPAVTVPYHIPQRSPVDILLRVFPGRRRTEVEATLHRCKGDVLQAIEMMVSFTYKDTIKFI